MRKARTYARIGYNQGMMYAEIALNVPLRSTFDYHIPPELEGQLEPGQLVQVSFRTAMQPGIVLRVKETSDIRQTKPILALLDARPVLDSEQIALAYWMSEAYLTPVGACLWLYLPPGIAGKSDLLVHLLQENPTDLKPLEAQIVALLQRRGSLRGQQLNMALPGRNWRGAVDTLAKLDIVRKEQVLAPPRVRPKVVRTVTLAIHPDQVVHVARHLGRASKQADLLEVLAAMPDDLTTVEQVLHTAEASEPTLRKLEKEGLVTIRRGEGDSKNARLTVSLSIPRESVDEALITLRKGEKYLHILKVLARENAPMDVSWLYAQTEAKLADLKRLEEEGLVILGETEAWRDSLAERDFVPSVAPPLTPEQESAWAGIESKIKGWDWGRVDKEGENIFLLHGVTGSGKTEIYLRAIEHTLAQGRQVIFLVPEIALTAQTIRRVASRFPGRLAVAHGRLSDGERYDTWRRARDGLVEIVVGARSALFTPFPDVGLIILDEEHDHSYKQDVDAGIPYYHSLRVAEVMMRRNDGALILGSATPDLETALRARRGDLQLLHLPSRIMGHRSRILELSEREGVVARYYPASAEDALTIDLPPVEVVDMRVELKSGNTAIFSHMLQDGLREVLARNEQAMLFLNRRGMNTYVFCRDCGYVDQCPRCDVPLTYHQYDERMRCHLCGYASQPRRMCPQCDSRRIKYFGAGTQHVEQELRRLFPQARVLRWDADTARTPRAHEDLLQSFMDRQADVLIGTQMVAKGLDLPLVTLVGVVNADVGLGLPDFRAGERTFQVLTQVAGRAGRGLLGGKAIYQTYQPEHYVIQAAAAHDYEGFYAQEIEKRREMGYPPFRRLVRILLQFQSETKAHAEAERAAELLRRQIAQLGLTATEIIGPAPCFFAKINNVYRWHILLRGPDPIHALAGVTIPHGWYVDIDPVDVL